MLFFTGIGLSLGVQVSVAGIGLNELILLFAIIWFIFFMPGGMGAYYKFFVSYQIPVLAAICLIVCYSMGYFTGLAYNPDERAIYQFLRLVIFALLALALPYVSYISGVSNPRLDLIAMTLGVVVSSLINWVLFIFIESSSSELPGQNGIGQNVALFFPFLVYWLEVTHTRFKKMILFLALFLFLVTSLFSGSKGSWLAVSGGGIIILLFSGRRGVNLAVSIGLLTLPILVTYYHEVASIVNFEILASAGSNSNSQRLAAILSGIYIASDYPFGVGTAYEYFASMYMSETRMHWVMPDPHNTWAHVASQAGFFGFFFFLLINLSGLLSVLASKTLDRRFKVCLVAIFMVASFLMQLSGEFVTQAFWWLLLGVLFTAKNNAFVSGQRAY